MARMAPLASVYIKSFAYCARLFTIGVFRRNDRTAMKGICDMSGSRMRPAPQVLPEIGIDEPAPKLPADQNGTCRGPGPCGPVVVPAFHHWSV